MLYMVEMHVQPGRKDEALEAFEVRGPNRNPGIAFRGAWIGTRSDLVYVLLECTNEPLIQEAGDTWGEFGEYKIQPVVDIEQY